MNNLPAWECPLSYPLVLSMLSVAACTSGTHLCISLYWEELETPEVVEMTPSTVKLRPRVAESVLN